VAVGGAKAQLSAQLFEAGSGFVVVGVAGPFGAKFAAGGGGQGALQARPDGAEVNADGFDGVAGFSGSFEGHAVASGGLDEWKCGGVLAVVTGVFEEAAVEGVGLEVPKEAAGGDEDAASAHGEADDDSLFVFGGFLKLDFFVEVVFGGFLKLDFFVEVFLLGAVFAGDFFEGGAAGLGAEAVEGADGGAGDDVRGIAAHLGADGGEVGVDVDGYGHG